MFSPAHTLLQSKEWTFKLSQERHVLDDGNKRYPTGGKKGESGEGQENTHMQVVSRRPQQRKHWLLGLPTSPNFPTFPKLWERQGRLIETMKLNTCPTTLGRTQLDELTSLRFAASIAIVLHHYLFGLSVEGVFGALIHRLYLGVDMFFILSGYILMHVYHDQIRNGRFHLGDFLRNRIARIYPIHLASLLLALWLWGGITPGYEILTNVFLVQAWGPSGGLWLNFPAWSVSAEAFAYLLFLPLAFVVVRVNATLALGMAVGLYVLTWELVLRSGLELTELSTSYSMLRAVPEFILGLALYQWRGRGWRFSYVMAALVVVTLILAGRIISAPTNFASILLIAAIATYMFHIFVVRAARDMLGPLQTHPLAALATLAAAVLVGAALYHLIEEPARRMLRAPRR